VPTFRTAQVTELISERRGLQRVRVRMPDGADARAYVLTQLVGGCAVGDTVVVNTTAVELGLGTGGWHVVHWNLAHEEFVSPGPEHIMKLRYTSLQFDAGTDELSHPECDDPLGQIPVVVCSVHSQVATAALAFHALQPDGRLVYVMTDGASLPLAMSDLVAQLSDSGVLAGTVTAGHSFGGDLEAVTVASALGLATHTLRADTILVGMGPGVVGTGTRLGTTAIEVAPILDIVAALGATPIMCVRASDGDPRGRHAGISHHSVTSAGLSSANPWVAAVPPETADLPGVRVAAAPEVPDAADLMTRSGIAVTTMGRSVGEDPLFFAAAAAAGALAAEMLRTGSHLSAPGAP